MFLDTLETTTETIHTKAKGQLEELCKLAERTIIDQRQEDDALL